MTANHEHDNVGGAEQQKWPRAQGERGLAGGAATAAPAATINAAGRAPRGHSPIGALGPAYGVKAVTNGRSLEDAYSVHLLLWPCGGAAAAAAGGAGPRLLEADDVAAGGAAADGDSSSSSSSGSSDDGDEAAEDDDALSFFGAGCVDECVCVL
jgi:hypothetical protein